MGVDAITVNSIGVTNNFINNGQARPVYKPVVSNQGPKEMSQRDMEKELEKVKKILAGHSTNITLQFEKGSNFTLLAVRDADTGKLIREMPPKAVREIAAKARDYVLGMFLDKTA